MADSALREKGREMRRKLLGDAAVERIDKADLQRPDHGEVRRGHAGDASSVRCGRVRAST